VTQLRFSIAAVIFSVAAATACRSAGASYYTLVAEPADVASSAPVPSFQLDVLPVDVPPDVDRAEIVVRESTGQVTPVQTRAWVAPLAREIRHALSDDLTRALGGVRDIAGLSPADGMPVFRVKLAVKRFESQLGKRAMIEAISTVRNTSKDAPVLVCSHRASEAARPGYAALAEAHQRALAAIAKQIAHSIEAMQAGSPATCGG